MEDLQDPSFSWGFKNFFFKKEGFVRRSSTCCRGEEAKEGKEVAKRAPTFEEETYKGKDMEALRSQGWQTFKEERAMPQMRLRHVPRKVQDAKILRQVRLVTDEQIGQRTISLDYFLVMTYLDIKLDG